jgi:TolB-like protein
MNKAVFTLTVLIFSGLAGACTSLDDAVVYNTEISGVIIAYSGYADYQKLSVYIDGKKKGTLKSGEIKGYELTNGIHIIHFKVPEVDWNVPEWIKTHIFGAKKTSGGIRFTVNNDRHSFAVNYLLSNIEKGHTVTPIETPVLAKPSDTRILNTAITNSFNTVSQNLPANSRIALINIVSSDENEGSFFLEELTVLFVNSRKFTIVDRQTTLDAIRQERNFQLSGEVSDETIISIGNFTGADLVITGSVSGAGEMRRLRLRVLDVKSAQVLAASSEKI